jgi:hypothetical protein
MLPSIARSFAFAILLLGAIVLPRFVFAQGCVSPTRVCSTNVGGATGPYLGPGEWQLGVGYRFLRSDRHFIGDDEAEQFEDEGTEIVNTIHFLDFNATYAFIERITLTLNVPVITAQRSQVVRDVTAEIIGRDESQSDGIGDLTLVSGIWIFEPESHSDWNVGLSLGIKLPTGEDDVDDGFRNAQGQIVIRTVDQSIQPGDGGFGAIFGLRAFAAIHERCTLYFDGVYLINPRNTNHVNTFRRLASESTMSVADSFVARIGAVIPILPEAGLAFSIGGRLEGVPVYDVLGESDGFRRPGVAVSVEPGIVWSWKAHTVSLTTPVAVYRNRFRSVPEREEPGRHGDAAFADYLIIVSYAFRFGGAHSMSDDSTLQPIDGLKGAEHLKM